jgi:CHAT domain-containing protein/tetratricopeptide (TPR) repeat protein
MRTIGTILCLFLIIPVSGRLEKAEPLSKTTFLVPDAGDRFALFESLRRATAIFHKAQYDDAVQSFLQGYEASTELGETEMAARFLKGIGNCDFFRFRYREALGSYLTARKMFMGLGDDANTVAVDVNLSSLYSQLGEFDAATDAAQRGLRLLPGFDPKGNRARLLILLANLKAQHGEMDEARELFREGILEADRFGDEELLSNAWDKLGADLLMQKQLGDAERALLEAYRIRKLNHLPTLGSTYRNLGMLRLEQGDLRSAAALLDASITELKSGGGRIPEWRFYQSRGTLRLAEGKLDEAHTDFRLALELVRNYRLAVPASDATRVSLEDFVEQTYDSFVETGSRLYFEHPNPELAKETFEATEENRAGSLAARLEDRRRNRSDLPAEYWKAVAQLTTVESAALAGGGEEPRSTMRRIRASLIDMESGSGGPGFRLRPNLLERAQRRLDGSTVVLSFHLARGFSCLWAVSASALKLYRLPDGESIARQTLEFRRAVAGGDAQAEQLGRQLYTTLFGALDPEFLDKQRWLLSLDKELFDLPFAALVAGGGQGSPIYLVERHSLRTISGASMWEGDRSGEAPATGAFVGIGDPIYNIADSRWREFGEPSGWLWKVHAASPALGLSRLAGSGPEVEACAREWTGRSSLLEGPDATKENVRRALAVKPAVVHFATHVLEEPNSQPGGLIALSVSRTGHDELLGPVEIGGWSAGAGLIVLSGCSSGVGAARPGAGLMGLTRAWLMGGARAVIATGWQTPDDVGVFFRRFYRQLQSSGERDPAGALEAAQIETIRSHDWRSQPTFWAAYFAMGNY